MLYFIERVKYKGEKTMNKNRYTFYDLVEIMKILRSENGCPWDREQTHESLKRYLIEETYEVLDAIDSKEKAPLCEELGDLLLQVVFHAQIANENNDFDIDDIITGISKKMYLRHNHVFGDGVANTADDVINVWDKIKRKEKKLNSYTGEMQNIPKNLPSLMRSFKVQQKAAKVGFDWENINGALEKVFEEAGELRKAIDSGIKEDIEEEIGDILFAVVNTARFYDIHPELALTNTIEKFINRFQYIEKKSVEISKKMEEMSLKEMDELWNEAKKRKNLKKD